MTSRSRHLVAIALLLGGGVLRLAWEPAVTAKYEAEGLLSPPLKIGVKEKIGQTGWAVTLGGLRTLVATFTYLQAYDQFASQRWDDLEKTFNTTVQLAPHSRNYWDLGSWHMAYNAGSYYLSESDLSPVRARAERQRWIGKGRAFMKEGVENNPQDPQMHLLLAHIYEDAYQGPDDKIACEQYREAIALGANEPYVQRSYLRSLVRTGEDPAEARRLLNELLKNPKNRVPTVVCFDFVFRWQDAEASGRAIDPVALALEVFGTEDRALRNLGPFLTDVRERWPETGVETTVRVLEQHKGISPDDSRSNIRKREEALAKVAALDEAGVAPGQRKR